MPQGDKSKYTDKQIRQAEHIEESYKARGLSEDEAEQRAWATVNKQDGGGKKGGSGRGKVSKKAPSNHSNKKGTKTRAQQSSPKSDSGQMALQLRERKISRPSA